MANWFELAFRHNKKGHPFSERPLYQRRRIASLF